MEKKICFVIAPIGDVGSETRIRSDQVLKHIIAPAVTECGYEPLRADQIPRPGIITSQVIQHILEDPLVIADLTGPNANVFYELAIRHAVRKPVVQIIDAAESIPFDVAGNRTISFNYQDLDSAELAEKDIVRQIKAVEKNPNEVDTPLTLAIELLSLRRSDNPLEKSAADIMAMLQDLKTGMNEVLRNTKRDPFVAAAFGTGKSGILTNAVARARRDDTFPQSVELYLQSLGIKPSSDTGKDKENK
jgi:hypothetical protein